MKKLFTLFVVVGSLLAFSFHAKSQSLTLSFSPQTVNVNQGETVCLDVVVEDFNDIVSMQFSMNYDPAVLDFLEVTNFNLAALSGANFGNPNPGDITISWVSDDVVNGTTVPNGTAIFSLCFVAIPVDGTSDVVFSGDPSIIEISDPNGLLNLIGNDGTVIVGSGGSGSSDLTFTAGDETVAPGGQVCVPVTVENFTDMISMQYSINYDPAVLEFDMAQNFNVPGLSGGSFGNPSAGNITLSWVADDVVNGETVADGTVIYELCFTAIGNGGDVSDISFSGTPLSVEVTDVNGLVTPVFNNGSVTLTGGGGGSNTLTFTAGDETVAPGGQVCVPVTVENFTDMISMQFSINFDPAVLQFDMVQNFNVPGLSGGSFGNPSAGNITLSWVADDVVNGETVADGTSIFELCFTAVGSGGDVSDITFSGTPLSIEVTDVNGILNPVFNNGSVTLSGGGGSNTLTFTAGDETVAPGGQICVPVTVENFTDMISMQYSINYDPAILQFDMAQGFNLPGLNGGSFGNPSAGNITLSWVADDVVNGETVANGTVIFELCFTALGSAGNVSDITFSGSPLSVEVTDVNGILNPTFNNGSVTISGGSGNTDLTFTAPDESVDAGDQICIDITADNFTDIVSMQYSINYDPAVLQFDMVQNFGLSGLNAGSFGNPSTGNITLSWVADDVVNGATVPNGTVLFQLCFTATGSPGSSSDITFSGTPVSIEVTDVNGLLTPVFVDGSITITGMSTDFTLDIADGYTPSGGQVCVDVAAFNMDDIISMQFSINYDPAMLQFDMVQNFNLSGLNGGSFGNPSPGNITVSWVADDVVNGETVADGTVLFQLCFTALGANCNQTELSISGTPLSVEVSDPNGLVPLLGLPGTIDICDVPPADQLTFSVPAFSEVEETQTICLPFSVQGFTDIADFSYTISFDPTILSFQTAQGFNLPGLDAGDFTNPIASQVVVDWTADDPLVGETVANGTVIFELCFEAVGDPGEITNVAFSNLVANNIGGSPLTVNGNDGEVEVIESSCPVVNNVNVADVSCFGGSDGIIDLNITSNTTGLTYNWSGPGPFTNPNSPTQIGILAGNYSVTVTSTTGCETVVSNIEVGQPDQISPTVINVTNESPAGNDGAIDIATSGGTVPYTFAWTGPGGPYDTEDLSGLTAGTYDLTVTDGNDCEVSISVEVEKPLAIVVDSVFNTCFGANDGSIYVTVSGGNEPYTYFWNGPGGPYLVDDLIGVGGGSYTLFITDANGSIISEVVNVFEPAVPFEVASATVINPSGPTSCDGIISINNMSGGTPPYTYIWGNGSPNNSIQVGLCAGMYALTVVDANGCEAIDSFDLEFIPAPLYLEFSQIGDIQCHGDSTGEWTLLVDGGVPPYTFSFSNGLEFTSLNGQVNYDEFPAGPITVTVTDSYGQELIIDEMISQPPAIELTNILIYPETGFGDDGKIDVQISGGVVPYSYSWDHGFNGQDPEDLDEDCYTLNIVDLNGCVFTSPEICVPKLEITDIDVDNAFCSNDSDGSIDLEIDGDINQPVTFTWTDEMGNVLQADSNIVDQLPAGTYTVVITDALGVSTPPVEIMVDFTSDVEVNAIASSNYNGFAISCPGESDGSILASASNGQLPYTYEWMGGLGNTPSVGDLGAGTYTVVVTDNLGCTDTTDITITSPEPVNAMADIVPVSCTGENDGEVELILVGGAGDYEFEWNDELDQDSNPALFLSGGDYAVTITDANNCEYIENVTVPEPSRLEVSINAVPDDGSNNGILTASATGGTPPYDFEWNTAANNRDSVLAGLETGEYVLMLTDAAGCNITVVGFVPDASVDCLEFRTVITPDGDGLNEEFRINCLESYPDHRLQIYNRWGLQVYETESYSNDWMAFDRDGNELPEGAYFFVFEYTEVNGTMQQIKGHITVIR